jgi:hypothetical protein
MSRWRDALTDVERVLQRDPAFPTIHAHRMMPKVNT